MERKLMSDLVAWKKTRHRKPLILNGARQVGKTWLLKEFGRTQFENVAYLSLDNDDDARDLFRHGYDIQRIISGISLLTDQTINPEITLIVIDEIQAEPKALTSLKYFCENAREYAVAAGGSLLGISATEGTGYPVGKVDTLDLHPLSFTEFLRAVGEHRLADLLESPDEALINTLSDKFEHLLKQYYVVGGMPEAVLRYSEGGSFEQARKVQLQILEDYRRDFAKHIPMRILQRTSDVWDSIPAHLAEENKKFLFGRIREGARSRDYEESLLWLSQAGLITKVPRASKPGMPLAAYEDGKAFKVFLLDVGLLGAMSGLDVRSVVDGNRIYTEFKDALTEQYVCQQLLSELGLKPFYWSADNSRGEIDFLVQADGRTYPIEVKAEENLRSKSLRAFSERYEGMSPLRFSLSKFRNEGWMRNIPLWAIGNRERWQRGPGAHSE